MSAEDTQSRAPWVGVARLVIGLLQGLALYLLYSAMDDKTWPATDGYVFAPLLFIALYVPLLVLVSLGNLRLATLAIWTAVASAAVAGLAWYDIWHRGPASHIATTWDPSIVPVFAVFFFTAVAAFIAQALVQGGDADRRIVATYATHFDVAWKLAVQAALAIFFVVVFWLLLELGAELFNLIGIDFFEKLIEHRWFAIPVTALATAVSIHVTDVRASLVRGARTLVLVLLSWLLPMMALIAAGFLASLFGTGLEPLWNTRFAAGYLLIAAGVLVVLINAAYQDGSAERPPPIVLRYAASIASLSLVPLVLIAAYAIALRVEQYGWTTERIGAAASTIIAASYAIGYSVGGLWPGQWLAPVARWNFVTAVVVLIVIAGIFSPIADPMRISVESQVGRLEAGRVTPEKFDFDYLRWHSGRFGLEALKKLAAGAAGNQAAAIQKLAKAALARRTQFAGTAQADFYNRPSDLVSNISVYPKGEKLPSSFIKQNWQLVGGALPPCMRNGNYACDAYVLDLAGDGRKEIAVISGTDPGDISSVSGLFAQAADGTWRLVGRPGKIWACPTVATALQSGQLRIVPSLEPRWPDVSADGQRLTIKPVEDNGPVCPTSGK